MPKSIDYVSSKRYITMLLNQTKMGSIDFFGVFGRGRNIYEKI